MKKSLIALAVLAAASGAAMAQSSVTLFGIVDTSVGYINKANANGDSVYGLSTSGNATSRLGFRGTEDLGGGLKAGFWLEGEIFGDNGNANGFNFQRRSTISLMGNFGEVRLGRDLTPTYTKASSYDVFGQTGIGQFKGWSNWNGSAVADANDIRASNQVAYYTPNFSGFTGGVGYAFDEQTVGKAGRYAGAFGAYDNGPLSLSLSYDRRDLAAASKRDTLTFGGSYDLNVAKLTTILQQSKYETPAWLMPSSTLTPSALPCPSALASSSCNTLCTTKRPSTPRLTSCPWATCTTCPSAPLCTAPWLS